MILKTRLAWRFRTQKVLGVMLFLSLLFLTACPQTSEPIANITISVTPKSASLETNQSSTFTAEVIGSSNKNVIWSASGGAVTGTGNSITYTAPDIAGEFTLSVSSVADKTKVAKASITVSKVEPGTQRWIKLLATDKREEVSEITTDNNGNLYIVGTTTGSFPGYKNPGLFGERDAFIAKYDTQGNQIWLKQVGTENEDTFQAIQVDSKGNSYAIGYTYGSFPGFTLLGKTDVFMMKFDASGEQLWLNQFGTSEDDTALSLALVEDSSFTILGTTIGNFTGFNSFIGQKAFIASFDEQGNQIWLRQIEDTQEVYPSDIDVDGGGNVVFAGSVLDAFPGFENKKFSDAFITKFDKNGKKVWLHQYGTDTYDLPQTVGIDKQNNTVVGGEVGAVFDFQKNIYDTQFSDIQVTKFNQNGKELWSRRFGTEQGDFVHGFEIDKSSSIILAGSTSGSFEGFKNKGMSESYIAKLDQSGKQLWVKQFGDLEGSVIYGVTTDSNNNIFVAGVNWKGDFTNDIFIGSFSP